MLKAIFSSIISSIFSSANVKTATSAGIGSGIVALGVFEAKIITVEEKFKEQIARDKAAIVEYVDSRHAVAMDRFQQIMEGQKELKRDLGGQLQTLDNRVYNLNQNLKGR